jgi:hypothetical protein
LISRTFRCDHNKYLLRFLLALGETHQKRPLGEAEDQVLSDEENQLMVSENGAPSDSDELDFSDMEVLK